MHERNEIYVDGAWEASSGAGTIAVIDATTEATLGHVPEGTSDDVDRAVAAARTALPGWAATPVEDRAKALERLSEALQARMAELATLVTREVGTPVNLSSLAHVGLPTITFASTAEIVRNHPFEETVGSSLVVSEPVGVVGCITPWNYPMHQAVAKVAPALAAGCTVVLKPSEVAPLSAFALADMVHELPLPAGVFNLVSGTGAVVGEALVAHPQVDMISFTGSTAAGRRVGEVAARTVKRVALELGGKSPTVILADADLRRAVMAGVTSAFLNSGQSCLAQSRMIVPRSKLAEVEALAVAAAESFTPGDPLDSGTRLGPLASEAQRRRVWDHIRRAEAEGASLLTGGTGVPEGLDHGFFVRPTVFTGVRPHMAIAQEEVFGPVLSIMAYDNEDEAVEMANGTIYGLAGAVWSADPDRARAIALRLRTGQVDVNGGAFNPLAPFGGYKQSGNGRELGRRGLEEFLEVKSLQL
ncbi:MAG: aldehyde dehydrogenase family protein [Actinobacteria bacterium]|nr:aldehyde dehydrogenase family protein [Actinomycetota bacterium]